MTHDYHDGLPGYSPNQILHDGCGECEARARSDEHGISQLDSDNFVRAWHRAADWNYGRATDTAIAEVPMLRALWAVQIQLERRVGTPVGTLPMSRAEIAALAATGDSYFSETYP